MPGASPRTTQGSFQLNGLAASRSVYVYWRQIRADQQNGPEFGYCALLLQPGRAAVRPTLTTAAYALFKDIGLERYEVSVTACNALGESSDAATLVIPVVEDGEWACNCFVSLILHCLVCAIWIYVHLYSDTLSLGPSMSVGPSMAVRLCLRVCLCCRGAAAPPGDSG